ncbi:MAG: thiamine pyrophosphate-dependent dehydrogenase E1 component subunit alpha, partial [Bdellovibrionales bacterium]|nr:thiamine pyrophosphate-dependent dehydrogenase E1 component subunit alpha [Bdellovibrionales bacterium]
GLMRLLRSMLTVRLTEEALSLAYPLDEMKCPMHMSRGEEAVCVGVCETLVPHDYVFGTYRSHALYLARTLDPRDFFLELFAKESAFAQGRAGSMHISSPSHGLMCMSAIVASTIPLAVGAAYCQKLTRNGGIAAVFFGDGATDAGVFWESVNFAALKRLPVLFVYEDNDLAVHTRVAERRGYEFIESIIEKFNINVYKAPSKSVEDIYDVASRAVSELRKDGSKPCFLSLQWDRALEHVGISSDFNEQYRTVNGDSEGVFFDPVLSYQRLLIERGDLSEDELFCVRESIKREVEAAIKFAREDQFVARSSVTEGLFR